MTRGREISPQVLLGTRAATTLPRPACEPLEGGGNRINPGSYGDAPERDRNKNLRASLVAQW